MEGQSGNPRGRTPGSRDKRTALRELLQPHAVALVEKAVALALSGDVTALKLCIDRLMPTLRSQREPVKVSTKGSTLDERASEIFEAATAGAISLDVAEELMALLTAHARIIEISELVVRIEALEAQLAGGIEKKP